MKKPISLRKQATIKRYEVQLSIDEILCFSCKNCIWLDIAGEVECRIQSLSGSAKIVCYRFEKKN